MGPETLPGQRGEGINRVTHETSRGMGVESEHERDEKVVSVPERFKCLLSYPVVGGGIHKKHAK